MLIISNFFFAQTGGCTPTFTMLPQHIKDKIEIRYDDIINRFQQNDRNQIMMVQYLDEFNRGMDSNIVPTDAEYKQLEELKKLSNDNTTVEWIKRTANATDSYNDFMIKLGDKIASTNNVEELNILVMTSYQIQMVYATFAKSNNAIATGCSG